MIESRNQAVSEMQELIRAAWVDTAAQPVEMIAWPNRSNPNVPPSDAATPWLRVTIRHTTSGATSLAGAAAQQRYNYPGLIFIQLFTAPDAGIALDPDLAMILRNAFERVSTPGGVNFRQPSLREVGMDGGFFQTNITVGFDYTMIV